MSRPTRLHVHIDASIGDDAKVIAACRREPLAGWMFVLMIGRSKQMSSDGWLDVEVAHRLAVAKPKPALAALIAAGLVVQVDEWDGALYLPTFRQWQETTDERAERQERDRLRKARDKEKREREAARQRLEAAAIPPDNLVTFRAESGRNPL